MNAIARTDRTILGQWWWNVDRWTLVALAMLIGLGVVLIVAGSPAVAERIGIPPFHFVKRHLMLLPAGIAIMLAVSLLPTRELRRLAGLIYLGALVLLLLTEMFAPEIKGARRWLSVGGFTLQASEVIKPALAVLSAWLFARYRQSGSPGHLLLNALLLGMALFFIARQPDIGTTVLITTVWLLQFFVAGMAIWLVAAGAGLAVAGLVGAYFTFPHVASRIDRFLDPASGDNYQIDIAIRAFRSGGLFGVGPGDGEMKHLLPDAHADFVFAVAGEELGLIVCLLILGLFAFIVLRGMARVFSEDNLFVLLATVGLLAIIALQAIVNMASAVHLIPTKGMPLPFLSYGGSALLALSITMGMVLALTRKGRAPEAETAP